MKKLNLFFIFAIIFSCISFCSIAKASNNYSIVVIDELSSTSGPITIATGDIKAEIIAPLAITKTQNMDFGILISDVNTGYNVVLDVNGAINATYYYGTTTAAIFEITGEGTYTYDIALPISCTIYNSNSTTMTVDNFVSNPSGTGQLSSGFQTLNVGATLHIGPTQESGVYNSTTPFEVVVNYN